MHMAVDLSALSRRSAASLRAFMDRQFLGVRRLPDSVEPVSAADKVYWRLLVRRQALEGVCVHYQSYDAWGDENDWNLNIAPDHRYAWLLDEMLLYALSMTAGAPHPVDPCDIKCYDGIRVIECELTPDNGLYGKFTTSGLPISSGGTWPDKAENQGLGPTGSPVGVYGVFAGDYGHGGRPEIHPFDALWRRFHQPTSAAISWDLGVFQDDSNRFNSNWSDAPIDVEFRVPFCVDFPTTLSTSTRRQVRFRLIRSPLCAVVAKRTRSDGGRSRWVETYTGRTVRFRPRRTNELEVSIEDDTDVGGTPFDFRLTDLRVTRSSILRGLQGTVWLSGTIVVRVAVNKDGFAYWRLIGPNSTSAASARDDQVLDPVDESVVVPVLDPIDAPPRTRSPGPAQDSPRLTMVEVRTLVDGEARGELAAEVTVVVDPDDGADTEPVRHRITVGPRHNPAIPLPQDPTRMMELESFDLYGHAWVAPDAEVRSVVRELDVVPALSQAAGLYRLGYRLAGPAATVEVDNRITVSVDTRYAPFRDGQVFGEEWSMLSKTVTGEVDRPVGVSCQARIVGGNGDIRRVASDEGRANGDSTSAVSGYVDGRRHTMVFDGLGDEPVLLDATFTVVDGFGLSTTTAVTATNYRVVDAGRWVERALAVEAKTTMARRRQAERALDERPSDEALRSVQLLEIAGDALAMLHDNPAISGRQVAGALRLLIRIDELLGGQLGLRVDGPLGRRVRHGF